MLLVASFTHLVSKISAFFKHFLFVNLPPVGVVKLELAAVSLDWITCDDQLLPIPAPFFASQDLVQTALPSFHVAHDWEWPPG